ncbi:MAG: hypothetical protein K2X57_12960 [Xanthobacteraceae bacterium]|nr:hypothetical protein [Xanthobacteraceae bacterium]
MVEGGNQLIVADIALSTKSKAEGRVTFIDLMPASFNVFEVMTSRNPSPDTEAHCRPEARTDLRLSTALVISARFPLISSEGTLRNACGEIATNVVDGGYFDNAGLNVAEAIVRELRQRELRPILLRIANDPLPVENDGFAPETRKPLGPFLKAVTHSFWERLTVSLRSPLQAVVTARQGHVQMALIQAYETVNAADRDHESLVEVNVGLLIDGQGSSPWCASPGKAVTALDVPMDWWLSPVTRAFMDRQLCSGANSDAMTRLVRLIGQKGANPSVAGPVVSAQPRSATTKDQRAPPALPSSSTGANSPGSPSFQPQTTSPSPDTSEPTVLSPSTPCPQTAPVLRAVQ